MNASFILIAALLLRNPFWPIGYEGEREEISAEARVAEKTPPPPDAAQAPAILYSCPPLWGCSFQPMRAPGKK